MNRKWYRLLVGCKLILEEIPIGRWFPFLYARRRLASPDVTTLRIFLQNKSRSRSKVKGQGQRSRSVTINIITKIPYYRGSYYFAKYFSQSILVTAVCVSVCVRVCLFVCLSVFKGSTGRTDCPIVLISFAEDVFWTRDNAELFFLTIGQRARSRSPLLWKSDNGNNFWTGRDRDFWWGAKRSLYNSASARASMLRRTTSRFYITWL